MAIDHDAEAQNRHYDEYEHYEEDEQEEPSSEGIVEKKIVADEILSVVPAAVPPAPE